VPKLCGGDVKFSVSLTDRNSKGRDVSAIFSSGDGHAPSAGFLWSIRHVVFPVWQSAGPRSILITGIFARSVPCTWLRVFSEE